MKHRRSCCLLALALLVLGAHSAPAARWKERPVFNVIHYGAFPDGTTDNSRAFANAIDACRLAGGGVVRVPSGEYLTGPITLVSHLTLLLEEGAVVRFSDRFDAYPIIPTRWASLMAHAYQPLLFGRELENVRITGKGTFDGQGRAWWDRYRDRDKTPSETERRVLDLNRGIAAPTGGHGGWYTGFLRPPLLQLYECRNVLIEGVSFTNSPFWTVHPVFCRDVTLRNLTIRNPKNAPNTDGIDIDSSVDVKIYGCLIDVGDDCVALKSGMDADGRAVGRPTERVHIRDCRMLAGHGGVVIGSEMSGDVRDVLAEDCTFTGTNIGIRLKTERGRGGVVERVRVRNVKMERVGIAIHLNMHYHRLPAEPVSERTPIFREIEISDITARDTRTTAWLGGLGEMPMQRLRFRNLDLSGREGFTCSQARDVELVNVKIACREGPALRFSNVEKVRVRNFTGSPAPPHPVVRAENARELALSRLANPLRAEVLLEILGEESREITLSGRSGRGAFGRLEIAPEVPAGALREL